MAPGLPDAIGRYEVLERIGHGGMGTLYRARDPRIGRDVAIKLLREGLDDDETRERFAREARSAGQLKHGNIVTIFEFGDYNGQPFIAMEYIQGETLAAFLQRRPTITVVRKLEIMDQICAGLSYAHRMGVVHRDIKPANIMVEEEGAVKILDFGIARMGGSNMTQAGMLMGTLNYMAPEQMEGKQVDQHADMFSVGAVFYEILAFRHAFPGDARAVMFKILHGAPEALEQVVPGLDPQIIAIINRCMAKQPEDRYPDLAVVRRELAAVRLRLERFGGDSDATIITPYPGIVAPGPSSNPPRTASGGPTASKWIQLRNEQIQTHLAEARRAFERRDYQATLAACEKALVLDPENGDALALDEKTRATLDAESLTSAREDLERGALTSAAMRVDKVLAGNPDSAEAAQMRQQIDSARARLAAQQAEAAAEAERLRLAAIAREREAAERAEAERKAAERREAERKEAERKAAERAEAERKDAERQEAERKAAAARAEVERKEAERKDAERKAAEKKEAKRLEAERVAREKEEAERRRVAAAEAAARAAREARDAKAEQRRAASTATDNTIVGTAGVPFGATAAGPQLPKAPLPSPTAPRRPSPGPVSPTVLLGAGAVVVLLLIVAAVVKMRPSGDTPSTVADNTTQQPAPPPQQPPPPKPPEQTPQVQPAPNPRAPSNLEPRQETPQVTPPPPPPVKDTPPVGREKTPPPLKDTPPVGREKTPPPAKQTTPPQPDARQARPEPPKTGEPTRPAEPTPDPGAAAKRALEDGTRLEKSGDLRAALDRYQRAAQIDPSMATIANGLADTVRGLMKTAAQDALTRAKQYDALDRVPDAITWYERAYANLLDSDPNRKVVKDRLDLLRTRK